MHCSTAPSNDMSRSSGSVICQTLACYTVTPSVTLSHEVVTREQARAELRNAMLTGALPFLVEDPETGDLDPGRLLTSSCLSESCAKIGDVPKSPVPILAAWSRRLATITSELKLRSRSEPIRVSVALLRNTLDDFEWLSRKC
jgi:hypothetical protein